MSDILPTLSVRSDLPVDPLMIGAMRRMDAFARSRHLVYFLTGAFARDLILYHVFGHRTGRMTRDIDIGICVSDWPAYDDLKSGLTRGGEFAEDPKIAHRLYFRSADTLSGILLDLLPFGGIERTDSTIAWPPDGDIVLNVAGFSEAAASAIHIGIQNDLTVPVVSLPALAVLKLSAWLERHTQTDKDALDFFLLARTYHGIADHANRFYGDEADLLRAADYDPELAGAALLGRDAAGLCSAATGNRLQQLFSGSALRQKLIDQMTRTSMQLGDEQAAAKAQRCLVVFENAFKRVPHST